MLTRKAASLGNGLMEAKAQIAGQICLGIDDVGIDRNGLIAALEQFHGAILGSDATINEYASQLVATVYQQFQYEEYLMETAKYPLDDIHTMEHNRIVSTIIHSITSVGDCQQSAIAVVERLRVVFRVHAENFDKALFDYFKRKYSC